MLQHLLYFSNFVFGDDGKDYTYTVEPKQVGGGHNGLPTSSAEPSV